jgi:hypothetical protein
VVHRSGGDLGRRRWRPTTAIVVAACVIGGCFGDDTADEVADEPPIPAEPTIVTPVDDTPFCRVMLDLATTGNEGVDDLDDAGGSGGGASDLSLDELVELYVDVADEVPAEIRPDFDVVLERLVAISGGGEVADPARAEESAIELSAYIERRCRGTSISPLPPPTVPGDPGPVDVPGG